jgi:hypothetical protein
LPTRDFIHPTHEKALLFHLAHAVPYLTRLSPPKLVHLRSFLSRIYAESLQTGHSVQFSKMFVPEFRKYGTE